MQKEIPILFKTDMVQALIAGTKTQTRRTVKVPIEPNEKFGNVFPVPKGLDIDAGFAFAKDIAISSLFLMHCPYGKVGDLLWVRETWAKDIDEDGSYHRYKSDGYDSDWKWKPSIHMPKEAARIWLQVTDIRVERLHDISEKDALKEGIELIPIKGDKLPLYRNYSGIDFQFSVATLSFKSLWERINGIENWSANPWVWVVSFKVLSTTGKPQLALNKK